MARKPNYSFEKQKKEKDRKAKKDAKRVARLERKKDGAAVEPGAPEPQSSITPQAIGSPDPPEGWVA